MPTCPKCNASIAVTETRCAHCGASLTQRFSRSDPPPAATPSADEPQADSSTGSRVVAVVVTVVVLILLGLWVLGGSDSGKKNPLLGAWRLDSAATEASIRANKGMDPIMQETFVFMAQIMEEVTYTTDACTTTSNDKTWTNPVTFRIDKPDTVVVQSTTPEGRQVVSTIVITGNILRQSTAYGFERIFTKVGK